MKDFKEIEVDEVIETLKTEEVLAMVLNTKDKLIKGGDYIKTNVYVITSDMPLSTIHKYMDEDNVKFFTTLKGNEEIKVIENG